jgi:hypothetical protein
VQRRLRAAKQALTPPGRAVVVLAVGSRLGAVFTALVLGSVLRSGLVWVDGARVAAFLTFGALLPLGLTYAFPHPAGHLAAASEEEYHAKKHTHEGQAPPASLLRRAKCPTRPEFERDCRALLVAMMRWCAWWTKRQFVTVVRCVRSGPGQGPACARAD